MSTTTNFDNETIQRQAHDEGWIIAWVDDADHAPFELQRWDEAAVFEDDAGAWAHVVQKAAEGSQYHLRALKFIEENSSAEFALIEAHAALTLKLNSVSSLFVNLKENPNG